MRVRSRPLVAFRGFYSPSVLDGENRKPRFYGAVGVGVSGALPLPLPFGALLALAWRRRCFSKLHQPITPSGPGDSTFGFGLQTVSPLHATCLRSLRIR